MFLRNPLIRARNYYRRNVARTVFGRPVPVQPRQSLVSFTFDDFPHSALEVGGTILNRFGLAGTYYVALGLAGKLDPSGEMFQERDLATVLEGGHELGCHTFSHCHSWETAPQAFENSVVQNAEALHRILPEAGFKTFSYPICPPRPMTKARVSRHFLCCRGGGQTFNSGSTDLNQLAAFFLEKSRDDIQRVKNLIDRNQQAQGWLIFATHDIAQNPTPYGCTPDFFEEIVRYSVERGARVLPVARALEVVDKHS